MIVVGWRDRLHAYLGGVVNSVGGTPLSVGGTDDHVHLLIRLRATHRLADVLRELKHASSGWAHRTGEMPAFQWQAGYGAFTVSPAETSRIQAYIASQEEHHRTVSFQEEYRAFLADYGVDFDERYLW